MTPVIVTDLVLMVRAPFALPEIGLPLPGSGACHGEGQIDLGFSRRRRGKSEAEWFSICAVALTLGERAENRGHASRQRADARGNRAAARCAISVSCHCVCNTGISCPICRRGTPCAVIATLVTLRAAALSFPLDPSKSGMQRARGQAVTKDRTQNRESRNR